MGVTLDSAARIKQPNKWRTHCLRGEKPAEFSDKPFMVWDIETGLPEDTNALGGTFLIAEGRCSDNPDEFFLAYTEREFSDYLLSAMFDGYTMYAHNGAGYDYLYFYRYLLNHPDDYPGLTAKLLMRGDGRVIQMTIKYQGRTIKLCDTFHILSVSLRDLTRTLAPEYAKKERAWVLPDGSINYFDIHNEQDIEYLHYDVLGLLYAFQKFQHIVFEGFGVNVALTSAGTAMRAWKATLPREARYWRQRPAVETFCRESYCGGLVFLTTTARVADIIGVDVNAMYAAAMKHGVPVGSAYETLQYEPNYPGFYRCTVTVPDVEMYPFVPCKTAQGTQWLRGTFQSILPTCTIEYMREMGYQFETHEGYIFPSTENIFETFLLSCETLENLHKGEPLGMAAKLMRNSLYGRFAMRPCGEQIIYSQDDTDLCPVIRVSDGLPIDNLYIEPTTISEPYMQVHWASWITAQARIMLNRIARATQGIYGDTDSVKFPRENLAAAIENGVFTVGKKYGEVKIEAEYTWFQPVCPKNYIALETNGAYVDKCKGIPKKVLNTEQHLLSTTGEKVTVPYWSVLSFKTLIHNSRGNLALWRKRSYSTIEHSASWLRLDNGVVMARHAQEKMVQYGVRNTQHARAG